MQLAALFSKSIPQKDFIPAITAFTVFACTIKFLLEGFSIQIAGHIIDFGHADPLAYGAILSPVLAAHGYVKGKSMNRRDKDSGHLRVDNPDL